MEVDHFDPRWKKEPLQTYANLFLASRHCNLAKGDYWPSPPDALNGLRLLNPCVELDYGHHIFEYPPSHPESHKLVGKTPAGKLHIRILGLNAETFVLERKQRSELTRQVQALQNKATKTGKPIPVEVLDLISQVESITAKMIPPIDAP